MVLMETKILRRGVRYRVFDPTTFEIAWEKFITFGYGRWRPAGPAFREAAKIQERIATEMAQSMEA